MNLSRMFISFANLHKYCVFRTFFIAIVIATFLHVYKRQDLFFNIHNLSNSSNSNIVGRQLLPENESVHSIGFERESPLSTTNVIRGRTKNASMHIAFLKVHKSGSTCMQNLFFRFGLRHHLNILLPKTGNYIFNAKRIIPLKAGEHYDIFACHTVYSKQWFESLLPADSVNIGIVREPVDRMISAAYYWRDAMGNKYLERIPRDNFIRNLVNFPGKYDRNFFSHTRNSMGRDFGFRSDKKWTNRTAIKEYLNQLNSQFLLVLIMEKINESLVMMRRLLNWSFIDIIYMKTNSHQHSPIVLNATEIAKFRKTSFLDFEIYEYFYSVFEMKLNRFGSDFSDEVSFFEMVLNKVNGFCLKTNKTESVALSIQQSKWDEKFQVTNSDCELMQTREGAFISHIRRKSMLRVPKNISRKST